MSAASPERERLEALSEKLRQGGAQVELTGAGVQRLAVEQRLNVACHAQPWHGPLYFCIPGDAGCQILGEATQVFEVARLVLRLARPQPQP
ncbi:hypothetical protein [Spirillospora sp. NPDC047279]|uniref:hypothetical protein n=1 Tax=Spirillospora sp. NPDC047279 TaxID=3155478 RepID=UPI0033E4D1F8